MPTIKLNFTQGTQSPPQLGTAIIKPTENFLAYAGQGISDGKMGYSQNIDVQNDKYGYQVVVPGPALTTISGNSNLDGVPYVKSISPNEGYAWVGEGLLGATNVMRLVDFISSGNTPALSSTSVTSTHTASHAGIVITDMVQRAQTAVGAGIIHYLVAKDNTDQFVAYMQHDGSGYTVINTGNANWSLVGSDTTNDAHIWSARDNNIYISHDNVLDKIDQSNTYTSQALIITYNWFITAMAEWNGMICLATCDAQSNLFSQRKGECRSRMFMWDFVSPSYLSQTPFCPSRYISAMKVDPEGNLLVFGGVDEGKCTIYLYTGYGFQEITSYIGDLPRNNHSVDFDGQGRIVWQTADGQVCRYNRQSDIFEHLGSLAAGTSSAADGNSGGLLIRGVKGSEFLVAAGTGSTYTLKTLGFGSFIGDNDTGSDTINTPIALSGVLDLPAKAIITKITPSLNKAMVTGDKLEVRLYPNGNTSSTLAGTMSFANDGAVAKKQVRYMSYNNDNMAIGIAWKHQDGSTTSPGLLGVDVDYQEIKTL